MLGRHGSVVLGSEKAGGDVWEEGGLTLDAWVPAARSETARGDGDSAGGGSVAGGRERAGVLDCGPPFPIPCTGLKRTTRRSYWTSLTGSGKLHLTAASCELW